jgi:hypothetical protein
VSGQKPARGYSAWPGGLPAWRGDVLDDGPVGAGWRQGAAGEHWWGPGVVSCKKSGDEAHRGGRAAVGQWEVADAAAFRWEGSSDGVVVSLVRSCR